MPFGDFFLRQRLLNQGVNPYSGAGGPSTPGGPPANQGLLGRLSAAAFPVSDDGGAVTPEQQRAAQMQGLLGFGTSLLANSGSQPGPRQGLGSLLGQALQQGQGAAQGSITDQLQRELLRAKVADAKNSVVSRDPSLVAEYKFAQANGYKGTFADYSASKQIQGQGGIGNFNPGDYTPDSLQAYLTSRSPENPLGDPSLLRRYAAPVTTVRTVEGVPTVINAPRGGGTVTQTPLSNLPATAAAAGAIKAAEGEGAATGKATGEAKGGIQKKGIEAGNVIKLLDQADALVPIATGSGIGSMVDSAAGFFGASPAGAQAAAELKVIGANLVLGLPRLEGPQSDRDTALYKEAAAQLGDDTVPAATKKAALATVRSIQEQYREQFEKGTGSGSVPAGSADVKSLVEKYRTKK
jgi:hypothetical protein